MGATNPREKPARAASAHMVRGPERQNSGKAAE